MSFRCEDCNEVQPVGTKPNRTVTAIRTLGSYETYDFEEQIAKEKNLCDPCAAPYELVTSQKIAAANDAVFKESLEQLENRVGRA